MGCGDVAHCLCGVFIYLSTWGVLVIMRVSVNEPIGSQATWGPQASQPGPQISGQGTDQACVCVCVCVPMSLRHGWAAQRVQSDHQPECVPNSHGSGRTYSCLPWFHSSKGANPPPWHTGHMLCRAEVCPQDPMRYSTFTRAGEEPPHSRTSHDPSPCLHGVGGCRVRVQLRPCTPFHTTAWDRVQLIKVGSTVVL